MRRPLDHEALKSLRDVTLNLINPKAETISIKEFGLGFEVT